MANLQSKAKILIVTDVIGDAELVKGVLSEDFDQIFISTDPSKATADFAHCRPDVLVLAFNKLEKSERYRFVLDQMRQKSHPHRIVVLCGKDEVKRASELCKQDHYDDYIMFWPMSYDSPRLNMSVYSVLRELAGPKADNPTSTEFAGQSRRLAGLKLKPNQQMPQGERNIDPASRDIGQTMHRQPRVLVVDDDEFQHKIVGKLLEEKKFHLVFANGGIEALDSMATTQPDIVLMDVMMPDMDGIEVTRKLKAVPKFAKVPVIMITGNSEGQVVIDSLKAGAADFVVKPFDRATLIAKIDRVLDKLKI